jgi:O-antigen ligase
MNHLQYSTFIVFTSLFLLNQILYEDELKRKVFYLIFFMTVTTNLFVNGGRIGYVAFFVTLFLVFILNMKSKLKAFTLSMIIITFSIFSAYNYSAIFKKRVDFTLEELHYISEQKFHTSFGQRLAMYYIGGQIIKENPLLGVGTGDEMDVLKEKIHTTHTEFKYLNKRRHFHNVFLHITVQLGVLGFGLLLLLFYTFYTTQIKDKYHSNIKYIFITVFLITCMTGNMFHQQFTMALLSLFGGLIVSHSMQEIKEKKV